MAITVWCPHPGCGQEFDVRDAARGLHVTCPACHRTVPIGAPADPASEPPPLPAYVPPPRPVAPPPPPPVPQTRTRRRRPGGVRRALGRRRGAASRFGREEPKTRHGCVTAWLVIVILVNTFVALVGIILREEFQRRFPAEISWLIPVMTVIALANVICAVALLNWKLWGFIGMWVIAAGGVALNLYIGASLTDIASWVVGPALATVLLQLGDRKTTWSQLE